MSLLKNNLCESDLALVNALPENLKKCDITGWLWSTQSTITHRPNIRSDKQHNTRRYFLCF